MTQLARVFACAAAFFAVSCNQQPAPATDDAEVRRIVTLAPHLAELVFAAGGGEFLVGVSAYSDYPQAVTQLPVVSDAFTVDQEQLLLLQPDLVLAWESGNPQQLIDELRARGHRVETLRTHNLADITVAIRRIGELTGSDANTVATQFEKEIAELRERHSSLPSVSVFYQVASRPLYTVGAPHYISEVITLCGGRNVFGDVDELAPAIDVEAVVSRDPDVMMAGTRDIAATFADWQRWPNLKAIRTNQLLAVDPDAIGRPSLRLVQAGREVCEHLQTARQSMR